MKNTQKSIGKLTPEQQKRNQKMKKHGVKISRELRDIIHGYIISDGYIKKEGNLTVEQGIEQEKFVIWLYEKLKHLCTDNAPTNVLNPSGGRLIRSVRFNTRNLLYGFEAMWYKNIKDENGNVKRRKTLPERIEGFFTPTFITLWFAGDGTKETSYKAAKIEVTAFTQKERERLQQAFKNKFDINTKINKAGVSKSGTQQWVLQIPASEYDKFRDIITKMDLIPTLFPHKLHKKST